MNAFKFFFLIIVPIIEFFNPDRTKKSNRLLLNLKTLQWHHLLDFRYVSNFLLGFGWIFFIRIFGQAIFETYNQMHFSVFDSIQFRSLNSANFIFFFLLFDYITYWWHRANHHIFFFRRFHQVHHSDLELDSSTTFRFHFIELFFHFLLKISLAFILRINLFHFFIFESLLLIFGYFHHGNIYLPKRITNLISLVIVTPRYHFNHHLLDLKYSNSNFSSILTVWDHLHGTYTSPVFEDNQELGIKMKREYSELGIVQLLKMPFKL